MTKYFCRTISGMLRYYVVVGNSADEIYASRGFSSREEMSESEFPKSFKEPDIEYINTAT